MTGKCHWYHARAERMASRGEEGIVWCERLMKIWYLEKQSSESLHVRAYGMCRKNFMIATAHKFKHSWCKYPCPHLVQMHPSLLSHNLFVLCKYTSLLWQTLFLSPAASLWLETALYWESKAVPKGLINHNSVRTFPEKVRAHVMSDVRRSTCGWVLIDVYKLIVMIATKDCHNDVLKTCRLKIFYRRKWDALSQPCKIRRIYIA
jgi:hypothetical protein